MMKKIYDLTELKRTFVSSKTKLFAALTIIIFMIVGSLHAQAKNVSLAASIDNIENYQDRKKQMSKLQPSLTTVSQRTTKAKFSLFIMSRPGCYSILVVIGVRTYL